MSSASSLVPTDVQSSPKTGTLHFSGVRFSRGGGSVEGGGYCLASQHLLCMRGVAGPRHFLRLEPTVWPFSDRKEMGGRSPGPRCVSPWKVDIDQRLGWHIVLGMTGALSAGREELSPTH